LCTKELFDPVEQSEQFLVVMIHDDDGNKRITSVSSVVKCAGHLKLEEIVARILFR
jgi:hypothetical protein